MDQRSLREEYMDKKIFNVGTFVENLNTGVVGKIDLVESTMSYT